MAGIFDSFAQMFNPQTQARGQVPPQNQQDPNQPQGGGNPQGQNGAIVPGAKAVDPSAGPPSGTPGGTAQGGNGQNGQDTPNADPFASFQKLWDNPTSPTAEPPRMKVDPTQMAAAVKEMDFMKLVDPTLVQKAMSGDGAAFSEVINSALRQSFAMAMQGTTHLVDKHGTSVREFIEGGLSGKIDSHNIQQDFVKENPAFGNKAVKPLLGALEQQIRRSFPDASPQEISAQARKYLESIATLVAKKEGDKQESGDGVDSFPNFGPKNKTQDWDIWSKGGSQPRPS